MNGSAGPAVLDVDRLLREFYQTEMPSPWPRLVLPSQAPMRRPAQRFSHTFFRLALAASLVLGLVAFWGVAGLFPRDAAASNPIDGREVGQNPLRIKGGPAIKIEHQRTSGGTDVRVVDEETPNGQVITIIGPGSTKSPR
jgi:hypothetical protein